MNLTIPRDSKNVSIDVLPIDATFMPIKRVSYNVENTRVGDSIEFDKLTLEIWSNGSIEVTTALSQASNLLIDHFMQIASITGQPVISPVAQIEEAIEDDEEVPTMTIEELELSVRAYNCLKRASINSMAELLKKSEHDLLNIKNFGKKSSDEVIERLHHFGLDLAPNPEIEEEIGQRISGRTQFGKQKLRDGKVEDLKSRQIERKGNPGSGFCVT